MLKTISFAAFIVVLLQSCAGNSGQASEASKTDTLSAVIATVEKEVELSRGRLMEIQNTTMKELDSLQALLKQPDLVAKMKKEEYGEFQSAISRRLSTIGKISALETLDKSYSALLTELRQSGLDEATRNQKLEELKKAAATFKDSILVTVDRITSK